MMRASQWHFGAAASINLGLEPLTACWNIFPDDDAGIRGATTLNSSQLRSTSSGVVGKHCSFCR
jgi:hypothetical protein